MSQRRVAVGIVVGALHHDEQVRALVRRPGRVDPDDPALFDTTLTDEYAHAVACGVSLQRLKRTVDDAVDASHLPAADQGTLRRAIAHPVNIQMAKTHLSRLVEQACAGEEVVIARGNVPLVRLVPIDRPVARRMFGAYRDLGPLPDTFSDPLPEQELTAWQGKS